MRKHRGIGDNYMAVERLVTKLNAAAASFQSRVGNTPPRCRTLAEGIAGSLIATRDAIESNNLAAAALYMSTNAALEYGLAACSKSSMAAAEPYTRIAQELADRAKSLTITPPPSEELETIIPVIDL